MRHNVAARNDHFPAVFVASTSLPEMTVLRRLFWSNYYLMLFGVGVSCRILCSIVSYLYVSCSGSITSVGEERANLSAIVKYL